MGAYSQSVDDSRRERRQWRAGTSEQLRNSRMRRPGRLDGPFYGWTPQVPRLDFGNCTPRPTDESKRARLNMT